MRKGAFTLVELRVVLAITALLAALLLPALSRAKFSALNAKCKSNARQFGIALNMYVSTETTFPTEVNSGTETLEAADPPITSSEYSERLTV